MSFLTCFWLFPQKEHFSRSPPSPIRATHLSPAHDPARTAGPCPGSSPRPGPCGGYDGTAFGASADPLDGFDTFMSRSVADRAANRLSGARADGELAGLA